MKKVGVIEDEMIIAESISLALRNLGYSVIGPALNFDDGLLLFKKERPDILLMDVNLNDVRDGVDLAEIVRLNHDIPIIFLSANSDAITLERCKTVRPETFLVKPFKQQELYTAIEIALYNHQSEIEIKESQGYVVSQRVCSEFEITEREFEIISFVAMGKKQREIAIDLGISEATVKKHLSNVFEKLNVNSSLEMLLKLKQ